MISPVRHGQTTARLGGHLARDANDNDIGFILNGFTVNGRGRPMPTEEKKKIVLVVAQFIGRFERVRSFDPSVLLGVVSLSNHRLTSCRAHSVRGRMVSLSFDFAQDSELVELSNHKSSNYKKV